MKQRCTIYDIARQSGVSTKTVSKVMNNKPGVNADTRQKVWAVIQEAGYYPHHGARTLRGRHRNCVGVTLAPPLHQVPLSQDFLLWLFAKLSEVFASRGAYLSFDLAPRSDATLGGDYGRGVWEQMYDVCLVVGPLPLEDTVMARIHSAGIPYLALGRTDSFPGCSSATVNFFQGAYDSVQFLAGRGHRRIALLAAFEGFQAGADRVRGYEKALTDCGLAFDPALVRYVDPVSDSMEESLGALLAQSGVTAFIESSVAEDSGLLRKSALAAGHTIGTSLDCVVWTYMKDTAVLPEAAAHLWLPVLESAVEGITRLAQWADGTAPGPVSIDYLPVLTDADHLFVARKPKRISDLL